MVRWKPVHGAHTADPRTVIVAVMFYATTIIIPIPSLGLKWWYGIIAIINSFLLILAYFFLYESKYNRPNDAERKCL